MNKMLLLTAVATLTGCMTSRVDYSPPHKFVSPEANVKVIDRSREDVWADAVPELGKRFFVINNLDKASGLINISYSGDPLQYVDCGLVNVTIPSIWGETDQRFPGAISHNAYRVVMPMKVIEVQRNMNLDGRVNLIFEQIAGNKTRVTANTRYSLTRQESGVIVAGQSLGGDSSSISFNSGGKAKFTDRPIECTPTGNLEQDILSAIK